MTAIHIANVRLFLFDDKSDYTEMGDVGCAIVATPGTPPTFRLGCYRGTEYLCTAEITPSNDTGLQLAVQGQGYVSFHDEQGRMWSMHFATEHDAVEFGAHVAVAMYGASNMPDNRIICCDVASGKRERPIYGQDRVKVRYQTWVLAREEGVPKLGSRLEGNEHDEKAYVYTVPPNHNSVAADMFGFEGMTVGMAEESRRFVVIPQAAKKGRGPAVHTVHMIYVIKKKDASFDDQSPQTGAHNNNRAGAGGAHNNNTNRSGQNDSFGSRPHDVVAQQPWAQGGGGGAGYNGGPYGASPHYKDPYGGTGMTVAAAPVIAPQPVVVQAQPQPLVIQAPAPQVVHVEQPPQAMPQPPPAGFNLAQMETIQRMRDLVGNLAVQLRDATGAVDMFAHDFKAHDTKSRPSSLIAAQMDHSLRTLMQETDELRAELTKRDETLNSLEETHKQLQIKAEKFQKTAQLLQDERAATLAAMGENKVDIDQTILSLQAKLTRVLADREDVSRHLNTTKRLLELNDKDTREAKNQLQIAEVTLQTNEAKMAATEESLQEERARRKLLEAKIVTLGDELRGIVDDFRLKDSQVDDRRRQMAADKLHYTQLMDDERAQAASELRELRQELIDELAVRDRRYQEERVRVAKDSFERGRFQGIEDGEKEARLEGDMQMQTLAFDAQRHRSELETVKVRLRQVHEQAAADRRRLEAQISALTRVVDELTSQNQTLEVQLHDLEVAKQTVATVAYEEVRSAVLRLVRPIGKLDLRTLIHSLRIKQDPDFSFQATRTEEEEGRAAADERETRAWVRRCLTAAAAGHNPHEMPPPMRLLAPQEPPVRDVPAPAPNFAAAPPIPSDPSSIAAALAATEPSIDMAEVERRQKELLAALHANNPALELAPPPPPPRTPTPPRRSPTPLPQRPDTPPRPSDDSQQPEAAGASSPPGGHAPEEGDHGSLHDATSHRSASAGSAAAAGGNEETTEAPTAVDRQGGSDSEEIEPPAIPQSAPVVSAPPAQQSPPKQPAPVKRPSALDDSETDDSSAVFRPEPQPPAKQRPKTPPTSSDEITPRPKGPAKAPVKAAPSKAAPKAVAARHAGLFDDDDDSASSAPNSLPRGSTGPLGPLGGGGGGATAPPVAAAAKRAPPSANLFAATNSDSDEDNGGASSRPQQAPASKAPAKVPPAKKATMFADSDSEDDAAPPPAAKRPAPAPKKAMPTAKRPMFADTDDSS